MSNEKDSKSQVEKTNTEVEETTSPWYYFYSQGCGFCKKAEPIVDELNKEGHNILKLDMAEAENQGLSNELKKEYKAQCGTPWFINAETGKQICGFREKDVVLKWLDGEDIPAPPRPKGPIPKPPLLGAPQEEEDKWREDYAKWLDENSHLPNTQTADQILERPRPKTEPPKPPRPDFTDKEFDDWGKEYDEWVKENDHLPNLQPSNVIINRLKGGQQPAGAPGAPGGSLTPDDRARLSRLEQKVDKLINHLGVK